MNLRDPENNFPAAVDTRRNLRVFSTKARDEAVDLNMQGRVLVFDIANVVPGAGNNPVCYLANTDGRGPMHILGIDLTCNTAAEIFEIYAGTAAATGGWAPSPLYSSPHPGIGLYGPSVVYLTGAVSGLASDMSRVGYAYCSAAKQPAIWTCRPRIILENGKAMLIKVIAGNQAVYGSVYAGFPNDDAIMTVR